MDSLRGRLERADREAILWIVGIVGFFLMLDAVIYFDFFGLVETELSEDMRSPSERLWRDLMTSP